MKNETEAKGVQIKELKYCIVDLKKEIQNQIQLKSDLDEQYARLKKSIKYRIGYHFMRATTIVRILKLPFVFFRIYHLHRNRVLMRGK